MYRMLASCEDDLEMIRAWDRYNDDDDDDETKASGEDALKIHADLDRPEN